MPLSQAQKEAILKLSDGTAMLEDIENAIREDIDNAVRPIKIKHDELIKENTKKKITIQDLKAAIKDAELDPDKPIGEQIAELTSRVKGEATKGTKPSEEFESLAKTVQKLQKTIEDRDAALVVEKKGRQIEKAKSAFAPVLPEHFGNASSLILKTAIADGLITVNDKEEPGVMDGENFVSFGEDNGASAVNVLKKIHASLVVVKQKGGSGNTPANGASGKQANGKEITRAEFNAIPFNLQGKFFKDGGSVIDG